MKKNLLFMQKKTLHKITNKEIRGKKKCNVFQCQKCYLEFF